MAYTHFVIISHLRSGTHLLRTMLESHPALVCQSEVFNSDDPELPYPLSTPTREILDRWVYREFDGAIGAAGFVLQIYHPFGLRAFSGIRENPAWGNIWQILQALPGLRVIHLRRDNDLRRHLSHVLARETGQWHDWKPGRVDTVTHLHKPQALERGGDTHPAVRLDARRLRTDFEEVEALHRAAERRFADGPYLALTYEALCEAPETLGAELLDFLGLAPQALTPAVSRLESRPLDQSIENFAELRAAFQGTPWARFFEA